uniref:Uncharacterized protein n=1 Tax=Romanomermis culicivorax TaxID=13658 RepID=A0A915K1Y9_ROMCU
MHFSSHSVATADDRSFHYLIGGRECCKILIKSRAVATEKKMQNNETENKDQRDECVVMQKGFLDGTRAVRPLANVGAG